MAVVMEVFLLLKIQISQIATKVGPPVAFANRTGGTNYLYTLMEIMLKAF